MAADGKQQEQGGNRGFHGGSFVLKTSSYNNIPSSSMRWASGDIDPRGALRWTKISHYPQ
jgi:hypothetical protein